MSRVLAGRTALVTGASRGIGAATASRLAAAGARVFVVSRGAGDAADPEGIESIAADLSGPEGVESAMAALLERVDRIDILVNNVGGVREGPLQGFLSTSDEDWQRTLDINLMSVVRVTRKILPVMLEQESGCVVNVASLSARLPSPELADYGAAKAAVRSLTKALSIEFAPRGVRVNSISPGAVMTPLWEGRDGLARRLGEALGCSPEELLASIAGQTGTRRLLKPEEIADAVLFLACAEAITGEDIVVDGGRIPSI